MQIWRIARRRLSALDGEGARLYGARWNRPGTAVVYASSSLSLAALEYLVHVDIEDVPDDLVALSIRVPDDAPVTTFTPSDLPVSWRETPAPEACMDVGDTWVRECVSLLCRVPSVIIPHEDNVLLNPAHPLARRVRVSATEEFRFDARLIQP